MAAPSSDSAGTAHDRALIEIALTVLRAAVGSRIPTMIEIQERLEVGSGTVQRALKELMDRNATELRMRGHQGTLIEAADPALLWRAARLPALRLVSTPPGAIESTVVSMTIRDQLQRHGLGVEFDFVRGAARRLELTRGQERSVALLSRGAAHALRVLDDPMFDTLDLGPQTYYRPDTLLVLHRTGGGHIRRIARDPDSFDHSTLTAHEYPDAGEANFVDCAFPEVPAAILAGQADAGVWHRVLTAIPPELAGLEARPVRWDAGDEELRSVCHAVLVWRHDYAEIGALLGLVDAGSIPPEQERLAGLGFASLEVRERIPWM